MSFYLSAPYPLCQTTTILPDPSFGDQQKLLDTVSNLKAMNGTQYTYVKRRGGRRGLQWEFPLTRNKSLELRNFILSYYASQIKVTDHNGIIWVGNFTSNPFEFDGTSRAAPALAPLPRGETWTITLTFEGIQQT
jgi:hypothetical protein